MRTGIEKVKLLAAEVSLNGGDQRLGDVDLSVTAPELQCSPLGPRDRGHDILLHYEIDPVTDLPSRTGSLALLDAVINQAQNFGHQIGVALVDLDDFQVITEAAGHTCAKDLLR